MSMAQVDRARSDKRFPRALPWLVATATLVVLLVVAVEVADLYLLGINVDPHLNVVYVSAGDQAARSGLSVGDKLEAIGEQTIHSRNHLRFLCRAYRAGDVLPLQVERAGGELEWLPIELEHETGRSRGALVLFAVGLAFLAVGSLVYAFAPSDRGAGSFFAVCIAMALSYGTAYASHPWLGLLEHAAFLVPSLIVYLFLVFPEPRQWVNRVWAKLLVFCPGVLLLVLCSLSSMGVLRTDVLYVLRWAPLSVVFGASVGLVILIHSMVTASRPVVQQQLKWIAWGIGVSVLVNGLSLFFDLTGLYPGLISLDLANWSVLVVPITFAFSILRYRLFDIDTVINQSVVYVVLTLVVIAAYAFLGHMLSLLETGIDAASPVAVALLVVALTVLFSPLYRGVQQIVDRVMYARRPSYRQVDQELLNEVACSLDLDHLVSHLVERLTSVTRCDLVRIYVRQPSQAYAVVGTTGSTFQQDSLAPDHPVPQSLAAVDELLCLPDAPEVLDFDPTTVRSKQWMQDESLVLCIPFRDRETLLGWVALGSKRGGAFLRRDERGYLASIVRQAGVAIQNALLYRESQDRARQLSIVNEIGRSLTSTLDLQELLDRLLSLLIEVFSVEAASLLLLDQESQDLVFQVAQGLGREQLVGRRLPSGVRSIATYVAQSGKPFVSDDVHAEPEWYSKIDEVTGVPTHQLAAVPLIQRDQILGVVEIVNRLDGRPFTESDIELLTALAAQTVMVVENARLYTSTDQALTDRVQELATMQEIDRQLNASLDFDTVMDRTLKWAVRETDASAGFVGLVLDSAEGRRIWTAAVHGYPASVDYYRERLAPIEQSIVGSVVTQASVLRLADVSECADYMAVRESTRSELAVPVLREQRVIGVINLESDQLGGFDEHDEAFVVRLADHAAIAMENARLYDEVTQANESKSQFVSLVSHELRAPMTIIKGYAELAQLTLGDRLEEDEQKLLDIIMSNVELMQSLINDLLQLAHIESGSLRLERYPTRIHTILGDVMAAFRHSFDERDLTVSWRADPDLPQIDADPVRLNQILTNLVSNAVKYTPAGGEIEISAEVRETQPDGTPLGGEYLCCQVRDSGIGISSEDKEELFGRFFRANHPLVRKQPGTGLGLAITRTLVNMHDGKISFESKLGEGSVFWFAMPLAAQSAEEMLAE